MAKENNEKVSVANILALLGLAAIGVVTFFGKLLQSSDGKPGGAIAWAVVLVVVLGLLLVLSIKAKSATDNPDKWKYVEYASLAAYIVMALLSASSFNRFFYIISEKENMQAQARKEVKAIHELYDSYDHQQEQALNDAREQLLNYIASGQKKNIHDDLYTYVNGIGEDIDSWTEKAETQVVLSEDTKLKEISSRIEDWNMMDLSALACDLEKKDADAWHNLDQKITTFTIENKLIPVIGGGGVSPYFLDGYKKFDLGTPVEPQFSTMLRDAEGNTILGWIIYILLNAIILLNYLVTARSSYVGPVNGKISEGLDL